MYYKEESVIYYNGKFIKAKEASENLYSQSLHYGNGVFEGIRAYNTSKGAQIFKPYEHYKRLKYGAEVMNIQFNYTEEELTKITYELLKRNGLKDAYIRPLITTGADMSLLTSNETNLTIQCWEWGKYMGDKLLRVKTSSFERPNPKSCFVEAKVCGHYTNSIVATTEAKQNGFDEALLLDMNEHVAEGPGANFFFEKDGKLFTAPLGNILSGITRQTIFELAEDLGFEVVEKFFKVEEVYQADGAFFTGTAAEVAAIGSLDNHSFNLPWEKTLGYQLEDAYQKCVHIK